MPLLVHRALPMLGMATVLAACQPAGPGTNLSPAEFQSFVAAPDHQAQTVRAARLSGRWLASGCEQQGQFGSSQVTYSGPGVWMERVPVSGCGQDMVLNVAWLSQGGRITAGPMAPGTTRADPVLQTDAFRTVSTIAQAKVPPCNGARAFVYDTVADPPVPSAQPAPWHERWTLTSCNKHVTVPVTFTPDGHGGTFIAVNGAGAMVE